MSASGGENQALIRDFWNQEPVDRSKSHQDVTATFEAENQPHLQTLDKITDRGTLVIPGEEPKQQKVPAFNDAASKHTT